MSYLRLLDRKNLPASLCLLFLFVVAFCIYGRFAGDRINELFYGDQLARGTFFVDFITLQVGEIDPAAQQAGLRKQDQILSIQGKPVTGAGDLYIAFGRMRRGDSLPIQIQRTEAGKSHVENLTVPLEAFTYVGYRPETAAYIITILARVIVPLFCLVLGFWVAAVRVQDPAAWALLFLLLSVANFIGDGNTFFGHEGLLQPVLTAFAIVFGRLGPLALFYFAVIFPTPLAFDKKAPWLKWLLIGPMLLRAVLEAALVGLVLSNRGLIVEVWRALEKSDYVSTRLDLCLIVASFGIFIFRTLTARDRDARRRALLLDVGASLGLLPSLGVLTWDVLHNQKFGGWPAVLSVAALIIFPLTMAYVIVVYRAMDVRVVLRTGVQYLLAKSGVRILQVVIGIAIVVLAATLGGSTNVLTRMLIIAVGFGCLTALGTFAERIRCAVDRRFFRGAYEADEILTDLANKVRSVVETRPLLELVGDRIREALHVPQIAILLDGNGAFRPAYAIGYPAEPDGVLHLGSVTLRRVQQTPHTLVKFGQAESWVQLTDSQERAVLHELGSELLLPLSLQERLLGVMSLGPKQSEEPFSPTDLRLLQSVAAQTGLALENGRLTDLIKEEARIREKQARELELGREVQERLFPQEYPVVSGLDYAGACRPALGVGGDYYDFIPLPDGGLAFAIGDVSGKGISAALLMATLRAFLRGQAIDTDTDLGKALAQLNRLVYESSAANKYATFFLGVLHPESRVFKFVNAGHNAPVILCASGEVQRLESGGCVVGLLPAGVWESGQVRLERGDLLVMYTDGVSEAMDARDEEWGEERLVAAIRAARSGKAESILQSLMSEADTFVAGAPQWDDMTLIVARVQ